MKNIFLGDYKIENAVEQDNILKITGYACHYDSVNLNHERVDANSFNTFFDMYRKGELIPKLNWNHSDTYIGGINSIRSEHDGLKIDAFVDRNIAIVNEMIAPNILNGTINQFSTEGYVSGGTSGIEELNDGSYYVRHFLLTDVAIVAHPADPNAVFTLKNFIREIEEEKVQHQRKIMLLL